MTPIMYAQLVCMYCRKVSANRLDHDLRESYLETNLTALLEIINVDFIAIKKNVLSEQK
jgi:hypothetical protein